LDTKVTIAYAKSTVEAVLKAIAGKTGVALTAGRGQEDWLSRELPVSLFVKDVPARTVLEQLPKLTDFHWTVTGEGDARAYQFWQDLKARQAQADEVVTRDKQRKADRVRRALMNMEGLARYGTMTPSAIEALKDKDPLGLLLASQPGFSSIPKLVGGLTREQQMAATTPEGLKIPYSSLSPAMKAEVRSFLSGISQFAARVAPPDELKGLTVPTEDDLAKATLAFLPQKSDSRNPLEDQGMTGQMEIQGLVGRGAINDFPLFDTTSPVGKAFGNLLSEVLQGAPPDQLMPRLQAEVGSAILESVIQGHPEGQTDPELQKKVKLVLKSESGRMPSLGEVLQAVHEASGFSILSDNLPSTGGQMPALGAVTDEMPLYVLLGVLRTVYGLAFTKEGVLLRLKDVDWAGKRDALIPQAQMARWKAKAAAGGKWTLGDLFEMAALTETQIKLTLANDDDLRVCGWTLRDRTLHTTRLLAALSSQQQELLGQGKRLALDSLAPGQLDLAARLWAKQDNETDAVSPFVAKGELWLDETGDPGSPEGTKPASLRDRASAVLHLVLQTGDPAKPTEDRTVYISVPQLNKPSQPVRSGS
jgi:hypothetical protein